MFTGPFMRRDVRAQFLPTPVPADVLGRILDAAHHAPSVGFMQPWDFIVIQDLNLRRVIHQNFERANRAAAEIYAGEQRDVYQRMKVAGILDTPVNICVTCDHGRTLGRGVGRQTDPSTDVYSTVCAVQNLWLAARAESLGVGWVSILDLGELKALLGIPASHTPVAYLCIGYVSEFRTRPDLEDSGWEQRQSLSTLLHFDCWMNQDKQRSEQLCQAIEDA